MRPDWNLNSLNDIFSVQTAPTLILLRSILCCRLPGVITDSQTRRTGAFTTFTPLNNVKRINPKLPQTPWCDSRDSNRRLDKCQAEPSSAPHKNTTTTTNNNNPPGPISRRRNMDVWLHVFMISFCWCMTLLLADLCGTCFPRSTRT